MAEQILFNFAENILLKLGSSALQQIGLAWGVTKELEKLKKTVSTVRNVLLDAQEQQISNRAVKEWLERLNDIVYDVDDLVDEFATDALRREVEIHGSIITEVRYFFTRSNPFKFRYGMGHKIRDVRKRLDEVAKIARDFKFAGRHVDRPIEARAREETHSFIPRSDVIGRENDKEAILQLLMHSKDEENVSIIPIVGLGGLGKTTLAQLVYHDDRVNSQFDEKLWVCISHDFDIRKVIGKILQVAKEDTGRDNLRIEQLQSRLRQILENKKYVLVLDDVWNEDLVKWRNLRDLLMVGARGSKIIVTTRSKRVAEIMGTNPSYVLKGLSNDDSLSVLLKWAFKQGDEEKHRDLVNIGREIGKKCGGVPLAARTLGAFLNLKIDKQHWLSVRDSEIWTIMQKENDILPILKLSYDQMPSYLKQCFAYCSIMEKGGRFSKFSLIYFWMAQGFIQSPAQNEELEDTGESYFNELVRRSFIEVAEEEEEEFKMHDLIHDLAQFVAGSECLTIKSTTKSIPERVRHVNFDSSLHEEFARPLLEVKKLRTISVGLGFESIIPSVILNFRFLHVLVFDLLDFKVPSSIGDLKHLRFFGLVGNLDAKTLPESFGRLVNLQSMDLRGTHLNEWPKTCGNLINLRYLEFSTSLTSLPEKVIGRLTSLRTSIISDSAELTSLTEAMGKITCLRRLEVTDCPKLVSFPSCLRNLTALKELIVDYCINLVILSESFASLTSLQMVKITLCPKLLSLPEGIDRVPIVKIDGMDLNTFVRSTVSFVQSSSNDWSTIGVTMQDHQNEQDV